VLAKKNLGIPRIQLTDHMKVKKKEGKCLDALVLLMSTKYSWKVEGERNMGGRGGKTYKEWICDGYSRLST